MRRRLLASLAATAAVAASLLISSAGPATAADAAAAPRRRRRRMRRAPESTPEREAPGRQIQVDRPEPQDRRDAARGRQADLRLHERHLRSSANRWPGCSRCAALPAGIHGKGPFWTNFDGSRVEATRRRREVAQPRHRPTSPGSCSRRQAPRTVATFGNVDVHPAHRHQGRQSLPPRAAAPTRRRGLRGELRVLGTQVTITPPNRRDGRPSVAAVRRFADLRRRKSRPSNDSSVRKPAPSPLCDCLADTARTGVLPSCPRPREEAVVRMQPVLVAAAAALAALTACSAPSTSPPSGTSAAHASAAPTTGPITVYTLEKPEHRNPAPITWHADSGTFFVGTWYDGSIYRGSPDDPTVRVFLEGQPGQAATGIGISGERLLVAGGTERRHPRLRPADQAAGRRVQHGVERACCTACTSPTRGTCG